MKLKYVLPLLLIYLSTALIYFQSLNYYFFQDDWYILNQLGVHNILYFFKPRTDLIYYRPLGMETFFFLGRLLFGLNPVGYHVTAFSIHLANITLLFFLILKTFKNKVSAILGTLMYATADFHYMTLSWLALSWTLIGTFFIFSAINVYLQYKQDHKLPQEIIIYTLFLFGLLSTEFAVIFPFFLIFYSYFFLGKNFPKFLKQKTDLFCFYFLRYFLI